MHKLVLKRVTVVNCLYTLVLAFCSGILAQSLSANTTINLENARIVALSDDSFPGVPAEVSISQFEVPSVDVLGGVTLSAILQSGVGGTDSSNDIAIWSEDDLGQLRYIAREGDVVPGFDYKYAAISTGSNAKELANGDVFFRATLSNINDPSDFNTGIFRHTTAGGVELIVSSSTIDPSIPSTNDPGEFFSDYDVNNSGEVTTASGGFGPIWSVTPSDGLNNVIATGGSFPSINSQGEITLRSRNTFFPNSSLAVWSPESRALRFLVKGGDVAPGTDNASFAASGFGPYFKNNEGIVSFVGRVQGTGVDSSDDLGIWSESAPGGPLVVNMREGDSAIGIDGDIVWSNFTSNTFVQFRKGGGVAFALGLAGPEVLTANNQGVWAGPSASDLHLVARKGDQAPGVEPGGVFSLFRLTGVTADGGGVFLGHLDGVDQDRSGGIWAEDSGGVLQLIARSGDSVKLPTGETVQLTGISFNPEQGIGEKGHIAFTAGLSNGLRGVFVSNRLVSIPEPTTMLLTLIAFVPLLRRCRTL